MKKFHVITGLPRAGSTLLCNILNQNPKFWASSTSSLPALLNGVSNFWGQSLEIRNLLEKHKDETISRMEETQRALVKTWYKRSDKRDVIFDKSRGWAHNSLMLNQLYPKAKLIICVRDLRAIFGSMEKQHRKNPMLNVDGSDVGKLIMDRASNVFSRDGMVGNPLAGLQDILRRNPQGCVFVQYEALAANPELTMQNIYTHLGEKYFEHNFENVENTADDPDGHYLYKFPHKGEGKVEPADPTEWKKYVSQDIAQLIMQQNQWYNIQFGYNQPTQQPQPQQLGPAT